MLKMIYPDWSMPLNVHAFTTTRLGGVSHYPYDTLNLGKHVNDNACDVIVNRQQMMEAGNLPSEPVWLNQTHSTEVIDISLVDDNNPVFDGDASYSAKPNKVCAILTADCLPVLLSHKHGEEVAAIHAGWRGLCDGILEATVHHFCCQPSDIIAWLGPAIGPTAFEVGLEVKQQFEAVHPMASQAFTLLDSTKSKYLADLYLLAKQRLNLLGITHIYGGQYCTYSQPDLFYSYRRDNQTGRMASVIWID